MHQQSCCQLGVLEFGSLQRFLPWSCNKGLWLHSCVHSLNFAVMMHIESIQLQSHSNIIAVAGDGKRHHRGACCLSSHVSQIQPDPPGPRTFPRVPLHLLPRRMSSARSGVPFSSSRRGKMLSRISQSARALWAWFGAIPKRSLSACCIVQAKHQLCSGHACQLCL